MTLPLQLKQGVVAVLLICAFVLQGTMSVLAGTTGGLSGTLVDTASSSPIAGARITAASPSQTATATTDASGRFSFVSLAPDTYTISAAATSAYDAVSLTGITVLADQTQTVSMQQAAKLRQIGSVTSRANSALVKPGTTADVYSIGALQQSKAASLGGGGTLDSAWSAITSVPGVFVLPGQNGYIGAGSGTLSIRGGAYDQVGYELDGIPVNRSFDNYPSNSLSSLGQQELQVYTGATPANAEASGLSGYINQVIRTGTSPAYRSIDLGIGSPTLYNKLNFETGGANPAHTFSYYLGLGLYNQNARFIDQFNGAGVSRDFGVPLASCDPTAITPAIAPSCYSPGGADYTNGGATPAYVQGPAPYGNGAIATVQQRDSILNLHFGLPQKNGGRDDIQVFYDNSHLTNIGLNSINDAGGAALLNAIGAATTYGDGYQTTIPYGTLLGPSYTGGGVQTYLFPQSPNGRAFGAAIDPNLRDEFTNSQEILKIQYQKNFGSNAYLRVYGYTNYSNWLNNGPNSFNENYLGFDPSDYIVASHSRGLSATFSDQINAQNLLSLQGSYTTATSVRFNNSGIGHVNGAVGYLVDGNNPGSGVCYTPTGTAVPGCNYAGTAGTAFGDFTLQQALTNTVTPATGTCGTGPCKYLVVANGPAGSYNTVVPRFMSASLTDNWKPSDKLNFNLGIRFDQFQFHGSDTTNSIARTLYFNAYNLTHPATPLDNASAQVFTYDVLQPRAGFTYSIDPRTVVRASYGRYAQPPNAAFEQYDYQQPNSLGPLSNFVQFGLPNTPGHPVRPEISNNYDLSLEHQFAGDTSVKLTPFLRKTQDQIQNFFLDQRTGFTSGLNVGHQTSEGLELELDKGDFARNGFAGRLSFAYTHSFVRYDREPNGSSLVDPINAAISQYNAYTAAGGGAACYTLATSTANGVPTPCGPGTVANPYFNDHVQALLDPNGSYPTFTNFPGGVGSVAISAGAPYVATMILQYKHGPLAITPAVQFFAGQRFGAPENTPGIQPDLCTAVLPSSATGDPRYRVGAPGGQPYDSTGCGAGGINIPDPATGRFDAVGQFIEPAQLSLHLQASYDVSKRVSLVANFANIVSRCFGGNAPASIAVGGACSYGLTAGAGSGPAAIGNFYNPGFALQPSLNRPYEPTFGPGFGTGFPFNMYFEARVKI